MESQENNLGQLHKRISQNSLITDWEAIKLWYNLVKLMQHPPAVLPSWYTKSAGASLEQWRSQEFSLSQSCKANEKDISRGEIHRSMCTDSIEPPESWNISRWRGHSNRSSHCWLRKYAYQFWKTWDVHNIQDRNITFCQEQDLIFSHCNETFGSSPMVGVGHHCDNPRLQTARSAKVHYA